MNEKTNSQNDGKLTVGQTVNYNLLKYTVGVADLQALGAATSGNVPLLTLPAGAVVTSTTVKDSTAVAGTSFSAATARVATANQAYGSGALNVFDAPGTIAGTDYIFDGVAKTENIATTTPIYLTVTSTGGNLSATTAGSIDVWITYFIRAI